MYIFKKNILQYPIVLFLFLILVLYFPILLFGGPGYYGDDINFIQSIHQKGALNGIHNWLSNYGIFYRPLGVTFLYFLYAFLGFSEAMIYLACYTIYFSFVFFLFKSLSVITKNFSFTIFVVFFSALFPLGSTVFLQISSAYQALTACLVVLLLCSFYLHRHKLNNKKLVFFSLAWFLLLLTYEQITGLILIFFIIAALTHWPLKKISEKKKYLKVVLSFSISTLFFTAIYVSSAGNPKLITLKNLNNQTVNTLKDSASSSSQNSLESHVVEPKTIKQSSRSMAFIKKIAKVFSFFSTNTIYSLNALVSFGLSGYIVIAFIIFFGVLTLFIPLSVPSRSFCLICILVGTTWFSSTLAPFFLYKAVHLPPYVLLIPSVGMAISLYGLYWIIWPKKYFMISNILFKSLFFLIVLVFPLQQYGYFFGLKEELKYWRTLETRISALKPQILNREIVELHDLEQKHNHHIFWLEEAIGKRYFKVLMGEQFANVELEYNEDRSKLKVFLKDSTL